MTEASLCQIPCEHNYFSELSKVLRINGFTSRESESPWLHRTLLFWLSTQGYLRLRNPSGPSVCRPGAWQASGSPPRGSESARSCSWSPGPLSWGQGQVSAALAAEGDAGGKQQPAPGICTWPGNSSGVATSRLQ